ncbi:hypothetical protein [Actinomyces lilanjuaniae]|uniref:hypothetical protein n=1 Tax=Actinomyces lilanjuaniae TaxID=2321394 RepID=UPI0013C4781B|nr:hypothetical protein [Actinomyces lilanjuaniae]
MTPRRWRWSRRRGSPTAPPLVPPPLAACPVVVARPLATGAGLLGLVPRWWLGTCSPQGGPVGRGAGVGGVGGGA